MSNEKDKDLDDFFRRGLEDPEENTGYMDDDWDRMEQLLDKPKKRGVIVYWLPIVSSVAALLLIFLGWWALRPKVSSVDQTHLQAVIKHAKKGNNTSGGSVVQQQVQQQVQSQPPPQQQPIVHQQVVKSAPVYAVINTKGKNNSINKSKSFTGISSVSSGKDVVPGNETGLPLARNEESLAAYSSGISPEKASIASVTILEPLKGEIDDPVFINKPSKQKSIKIKRQAPFRPQYALTVLAAPDANGVGSFQQSKLGTNVGLGFSADVSRKFTVSTGVLYSVKPYMTAFDNYHTAFKFSENPVNVTADCRMLDIPLNIGYQLYNKHQNKFSVGTGLSSYIMLHENYKFNYADSYATGPSNYTVPHSGKYFFGVANLNATYQRQLNEKMGISVQPYLKLPLTDIGYSQVKLQTTGVAIGITWNLNSLSKP